MKEDGGPAYPYVVRNDYDDVYKGMSLRDYFAGQALMGMLARDTDRYSKELVAVDAYQYADAMLAERSKE